MLEAHPEVLESPPSSIVLGELADSSLNFCVRPWINSQNYLRLQLELVEAIKKKLDEENIVVPFPQQDVHFISSSEVNLN